MEFKDLLKVQLSYTTGKGWDNAKKWAYLLSLSTTTKIVSFLLDFGKPSIKSMDISS